MIFISGDTHGSHDISKLKILKGYNLTYDDYLIILGDSAIVWHGNEKDQELLKWYKKNVPCKVLFIDGNHDNHDALKAMDVIKWSGGNIHQINEQIIHLMRGQIYNINGSTFLTMGGGFSVDKDRRKEGVSWWSDEMPSDEDYLTSEVNLLKHNYKVNYILSHEAPAMFMKECIPTWARIQFGNVAPNRLNYYFDDLYNDIEFDKWYWGHYHTDTVVNEKCKCLYEDVIRIKY